MIDLKNKRCKWVGCAKQVRPVAEVFISYPRSIQIESNGEKPLTAQPLRIRRQNSFSRDTLYNEAFNRWLYIEAFNRCRENSNVSD